MSCHRGFVAAGVFVATLATSALVAAWNAPHLWHRPAYVTPIERGGPIPGGGGIYGTGGASDHRVRCSHCHVDPDGRVSIDLDVTPAFGTASDGTFTYVPGTRYAITVELAGERLERPNGYDLNNMAATVENASGDVVGRFITDSGADSASCPRTVPRKQPGFTTFVVHDCHGVLSYNGPGSRWSFEWVAPGGGEDLTLYVTAVDGDGDETCLHDDVAEATYPLQAE